MIPTEQMGGAGNFPETSSYLQRFDERFPLDNFTPDGRDSMHSFLTQERQQLIQEAVELGEELKIDAEGWDGHRHNAAITVYQEMLSKLNKLT